MRKIALAVVLLVGAMFLLASGAGRDTVKVYFTVGPVYSDGATQLWRCNRDGSAPELLLEADQLQRVEVDSETQRLFYSHQHLLYVADLDGGNPTVLCGSVGYTPPVLQAPGFFPVDAQEGYFCVSTQGLYIVTGLPDGSDVVSFDITEIPGTPDFAFVADIALYVGQESPVKPSTWGRIKSAFR